MNTRPDPFPDVRATAQKLYDHYREGITLTRTGETATFKTGYAVGGACAPLLLTNRVSPETAVEAIARWIQQTPTNIEYFGVWYDDSVIYIDGIDIVDAYADAILLGYERGEKAIFSFAGQWAEQL